jgi:hypothetical protein
MMIFEHNIEYLLAFRERKMAFVGVPGKRQRALGKQRRGVCAVGGRGGDVRGGDVRGKMLCCWGRGCDGVGAVAHGVCVFSFACGENVMSHRKHRNHRKFLPAAK